MRFEEALLLAGKGQLITRPGYGVSFAAIREGQAVYGHFIGETGFTDVRAYVFTDEDKSATDWELFHPCPPRCMGRLRCAEWVKP